jgi:predicted alternative tryptophan synthase beta-subunit
MSAAEIAKRHLELALSEAKAAGYDVDATARYMLGSVVQKYLEYRTVKDVRAELQFVAENCDPDTDFMFMRP